MHPTFYVVWLEPYGGKNPEWEVVDSNAEDTGWKIKNTIAREPSHHDESNYLLLIKREAYLHD